MKNLKTGTLIAMAAGGLFFSACKKDEAASTGGDKPGAAPAPTAEKSAKVDCGGVNECKGQGTCKQEGHGCGGQNECKGKGVVTMTESDCKAKGGTITATK